MIEHLPYTEPAVSGGIVMVMSGFPRRSETFALNELRALEASGLLTQIFATKPGDGARPHPGSEALLRRVRVLPAGSARQQAAMLVEQLAGRRVTGVHAYFAHTPAEVAARAAGRLGVPYGFSVHARDARKITPRELAARARAAACVIACNHDVAREIPHGCEAMHVVPHGVDLLRFRPRPVPAPEPLRILAVGRLVAKKGFDVLLEAVVRLDRPVSAAYRRRRCRAQAACREHIAAGLDAQVVLVNSMTHDTLPAEYAAAHVVAVPSVVDRTGDRDGLPNVVLEAMASGRPVVASDDRGDRECRHGRRKRAAGLARRLRPRSRTRSGACWRGARAACELGRRLASVSSATST